MELKVILFFALVAGSQAGPIQEVAIGNQCASTCTGSNKFDYKPGTTYEFKYENEIRTALQGAAKDHAGLLLSATVNLDFVTECEAVMRLSDVIVKEHDPETSRMKVVSAELKTLLEKDPVGFSFQDGKVEQICLAEIEDVKVLNIKRGILSMFQNNMDDISREQTVKESDVAGTCDTNYTSADKGWYNVVVKKSKNILSCTDRHDARTALQGIPYGSQSKIQTLPLIKSTHVCEQEMVKETGRLVSANCKEQHVFAPFSRENSGAITHSTQDLTFVKHSQIRPNAVSTKKTASLHYDHAIDNTLTNPMEQLEAELTKVCETTNNGITQETPRLFTSLIHTLKRMGASELATVYQKIDRRQICKDNNDRVRKFFLDAIPMAGTPASLKMLTQFLVDNTITGVEAEMWLTSLAFIQDPTVEMLAEVKKLLSIDSNEEKAMLSVSSLVNSLCRNNPDCENYMEVRKIVSLLENKIAPSCKVTTKTMQRTLMALRALGNAGFGTSAIPTLQKCILQSSNPIEVRLSAIDAFRRIPCHADKSVIMSVFTSTDEDSELRIAAYKTLMECPSTTILRKVKLMLEREEINQVGSYVWSHLTNLMETSDPHKQTIKAILQDAALKTEFDMDKRKFSRNYEGSFMVEKLNTGATAEGDLVWSSKSFIPRSAMMNLTVDLFGNAINLFEIGGRVEGLEYFFEKYFGPNGYFSENDVQEAVDETAVQTIKGDKANRINKRMGTVMDDLRGSLYMRVFGNEIRYMNFQGIDSLFAKNINILDLLAKLTKNNDVHYSHSSMIVDSSLMIPTYSGFPMNLTVNGVATTDLKASGKLDVTKLSSRPREMEIQGTIKPSAALEFTSTMSVDAMVTKVGLKMVSSMFTSTAVQGKVSMADGSILNVEFDLPQDKMEILNIKSSFFSVHRNIEREQKMITENRQSNEVCTGNKIAKISGLELCGELSYPNASLVENAPYFPLTGPVSASIILHKRDTLTGYKFEARSVHTASENVMRMAFSTPNSKINRKFVADINLNKQDGTLDLTLDTPMKKAYFAGNYHFTKKSAGISGKLNFDNAMKYEVEAGFKAEKSGPGMEYSPYFTVQVPGKTTIDLSGSIKYAPWKLLDVDMSLSGIVKPPMKLQVSYMNKLKVIRLKASAQVGKKQEYSVDASCTKTILKKKIIYSPQLSIRTPTSEVLTFGGSYTNIYGKLVKLTATLDKIFETPIVIKKAIFGKKQYSRGRQLYNVNLDVRSSPVSFQMKSKFDNRNMKTLGADVDLTYVIKKFARDNIKLETMIINQSSKSLTKFRLPMKFSSKRAPENNFKLTMNADKNKKHSQIDAEFIYGPDLKDKSKQISMIVSLDKIIRGWSKADVEFNGQFSKGNDLRLVSKIDHTHNVKGLDTSVTLRFNKNAITSSLTLKDQSTDLKQMTGQFDLIIPGKKISVSQIINETKSSEFISQMNARIGKMQSTISTSWKRSKPSALDVNTQIDLYNMDTITVDGSFDIGTQKKSIASSLQFGKDKYSFSTEAKVEKDISMDILTDIECPSRRVILSFDQNKKADYYINRADLRWNVDRDDTQRLVVKSKSRLASINDLEGSLQIQYPTRNIAFNIEHHAARKYVSHIDMQWVPNEVYAVDTVFGKYEKDDVLDIEGNVKISTPFKTLKNVKITINQKIEPSNVNTKLDVQWTPGNLISSTLSLKMPLSLRNIDAEIVLKTPFKQLKNGKASLRHSFNNGISTVGKLNWNKQNIQMDMTFDNSSNGKQTQVKAEVNLKTSFSNIRLAKITGDYFFNGKSLRSGASVTRNKKTYGFTSSLKHNANGWDVINNGEIKVFSPSEEVTGTWEHSSSINEITSMATVDWGKDKNIMVKYNGLQTFRQNFGRLSSALEVKSTLSYVKDVVVQVRHEHSPGQIDSSVQITNEGSKIVSAQGKHLMKNGEIKTSVSLSNPITGRDIQLKFESSYDKQPKTMRIDIYLTPQRTITIDGLYTVDRETNIDSSLTISSPSLQPILMKAQKTKTSKGIKSSVSIDYSDSKHLSLQTLYKNDDNKHLQITVNAPGVQESSFEISMKNTNSKTEIAGSIEALPLLNRWSAEGSLDKSSGASIRINTPYSEYPYYQMTATSKKIGTDRVSTILVEFRPGQIIKFVNTYDFESMSGFKLLSSLETPFTALPKVLMEISHQGDLNNFVSHGFVDIKTIGKFGIDTTLATSSGIDGTLAIMLPSKESIRCSIRHTGSLNNFNTKGEMTWQETRKMEITHRLGSSSISSSIKLSNGENTASANVELNKGSKTTSTITIQTPFKNLEMIKFANSIEGQLKQFKTHTEMSMPIYGTYSTDLTVDVLSTKRAEIIIQTPIKGYRMLKTIMSLDGVYNKFDSNINVQIGTNVYTGNVKFMTNPAINLVLSLKTPITGYRYSQLSLTHEGSSVNFKSNVGIQINKAISELDISYSYIRKLNVDIAVKSSYFDDIKISLDHWGKLSKFTSKLRARQGKQRLSSDLQFQVNPSIKAQLSFRSPIPYLKNQQITIKHAGTSESFRCNLVYKCNGNSYVGEAVFANLDSVTGNLNLKGTGMKPLKVDFEHKTSPSVIKSSAEASIGKQTITLNGNIDTRKGLEGSVSINTPFKMLRSAEAKSHFTGSASRFNFKNEITLNKQSTAVLLTFDNTRDLAVTADIQTPFNGYESLSGSIKHINDQGYMETIGQYKLNGKAIDIRTSFSNKDTTMLGATITSQYPKVSDIDASFSFDKNTYSTRGALSIDRESYNIDAKFDKPNNGYSGKFSTILPWVEKKAEADYKLIMKDDALQYESNLAYGGEKMLSVICETNSPLNLLVEVSTPLKEFETTRVSLSNTMTSTDLTSESILLFNGEKHEAKLNLMFSPDIDGSFTLKSPLIKDIDVSASMYGKLTNFKTQGLVLFGGKMILKPKVDINVDDQLTCVIDIKSAFAQNIKVSVTHKGSLSNFESESNFLYGRNKIFDAIVQFQLPREAEIRITSPFLSKQPISAIMRQNINPNGDSDAQVEISVEGLKHEADLSFSFTDNVQTSFSVKSPLMTETRVSFNSNKDYKNLRTDFNIMYGPQQIFELRANTETRNEIMGSISMKIYENEGKTLITFNNNDLTRSMDGHFEANVNDHNIQGDMSIITLRNFEASANVKSSFYEPLSASVSMIKSQQRPSFHVEMAKGSDKHAIDINIDTRNKKSAKISIASPYIKPTMASATINGRFVNFDAIMEFNYGNKKSIVKAVLDIESVNKGTLEFQSPITKALKVSYEVNGNFNAFRSVVNIEYENKRIVDFSASMIPNPRQGQAQLKTQIPGFESTSHSIDVKIETLNRISGSIDITSSFIQPTKLGVTITGHLKNFDANMVYSYGRQQSTIQAVLDIESPYKGKLEFLSPVSKPLKASYEFVGKMTKFNAGANIEYGQQTIVDLNARTSPKLGSLQLKTQIPGLRAESHSIDYKIDTQDKLSGSLIVSSSMVESIRIDILINGSPKNFDASFSFMHGEKQSDIKAVLNIESLKKVNFEFKSPVTYDIKMSYELNGQLTNFKSAANLEYGNEHVSLSAQLQPSPLQGEIKLETKMPGYEQLVLSFKHDSITNMKVNSNVEIDISGSKTEFDIFFNTGSKFEGRASAKSPYFPTTIGEISMTGNLKNFETNMGISFGITKYGLEASADLTSGMRGLLKLETPLKGYKIIQATVQHTGSFPEITSSLEITSGRRSIANVGIETSANNGFSGKAHARSLVTPTLQASVKHSNNAGYATEAEFKYNNIVSTFKSSLSSSPSIEGTYAISLPWTSSNGQFSLVEKYNGMELKSDLNIDSKSAIFAIEYHTGSTFGGSFDLKTPFPSLNKVKGTADLRYTQTGFSAQSDLQMPQGQTYEIKAMKNGVSGSLSLKTPFNNMRYSAFDMKFEGQFPNAKTEIALILFNKKFSLDGELDNSKGKLILLTPFEPFKSSTFSFNKRGTLRDLQLNIRLSAMEEEFFVTLDNKMDNRKLETKARLSTPYTEDASFELEHSGTILDFYNSLVFSLGSQNSVISTTTFRLENVGVELDSALSTVFAGYRDEQKVKISAKQALPNFSGLANLKLFGREFSLESTLETERNIVGNLVLRTPFQNLRNVQLSIDHSGNTRRFETKASMGVNSEKISGEISYLNYALRRIQTSFDMKSTIIGYENMKGSYRHSSEIDGFECDADATIFDKDFSGSIRASNTPLKAQITINTPFRGYEQIGADVKLDQGNDVYNYEANVAFMQDKTISVTSTINMRNSPKEINLAISTPFQGFEQSEIKLTHNGNLMNFQSDASISLPFMPAMGARINLRSSSLANFDATLVFECENMENLKLNILNEVSKRNLKSHIETSWAPSQTITIDVVAADGINSMNAELSVSTPFEAFKTFSINSNTREAGKQLSNALIIKHNEETCLDMEVSAVLIKSNPSASVNIKEPITMKAALSAVYGENIYKGKFLLNDEFTIGATHDMKTKQSTFEYQCPQNKIEFNSHLHPVHPKANIIVNNQRYGYEMTMAKTKSLKVILPERNLMVSGSYEGGMTEGKFMWDADRDDTKMIGMKSELTGRKGSMKADISIQMPSIGKDVQIDSEMVLNSGRILFEGTTDLKYSSDSRKTLTLTSRVMDISNDWSTKNYSFTFGVNHPYSTVGVQMSSHFGNSADQLTGGLNLDYLTAQRETKQFSVNGEINKLRKSATFNMETPLKKINIIGNTRLQSPFSVSLINQYDNKRPMKTVMTLDPIARKVDFQMNYDLDNPTNAVHVSAKYVNNSAILGEISHIVNRQKITDALVSMRLNSSHLLHSRVHWRPAMVNDLKSYLSKNTNGYKLRLADFARVAASSAADDINLKSRIIHREMIKEMKPFIEMYKRNDYHVRDITDSVVDYAIIAKNQCTRVGALTIEGVEGVAVNVKDITTRAAKNIEIMSVEMLSNVAPKFDIILEPLYNISEQPLVRSLRNQVNDHYTTYMDTLYAMPKRASGLSSQLSSVWQRDYGKYIRSYNVPFMHQANNAYKYWEVRENAEMVVDAIVDWIKSEVEQELSDLKASLINLKETKFTVYDPAHGEIQVEVYLPIPLRSLDEVPVVDVAPIINKAKLYKNSLPMMPQISSDVTTWIPPFNAYASIHGDHVTTFDGFEYNLDGSCSFLLARDFVDGNFSLVLHKQESGKSLLIMADKKAITIQADGKVLVDNKPVETPFYYKNLEVVSNKVETTVKGAGSFEVSYSPLSDLATVKLNGWYYGKTAGLLGTYDNEPSNDLMSSYSRPINNPARFARTWDMSTSKCR